MKPACVLTGRSVRRPHPHEQRPHPDQTTMCGRQREPTEWVFTDPTHLVLHASNGGRIPACHDCCASIVGAIAIAAKR